MWQLSERRRSSSAAWAERALRNASRLLSCDESYNSEWKNNVAPAGIDFPVTSVVVCFPLLLFSLSLSLSSLFLDKEKQLFILISFSFFFCYPHRGILLLLLAAGLSATNIDYAICFRLHLCSMRRDV
jgi:hypothetical protein